MASRSRFVSVVVLPLTLVALAAFPLRSGAQSRPSPRDAGGGGAAPDADREAPREQQRLRANDDDWFRAPVTAPARDGGYGDAVADFPSAEVHDAVVANTRAAVARAMFRRAESGLGSAVRRAQRDFESSAALREAQAAEQKAYDDYEAARREALRDVSADAKYQAMQDLRQNLSRQIADRRESIAEKEERAAQVRLASARPPLSLPPREDLVAMADLKMRVGADARAMEREALSNNERVRSARDEYLAANARVAALRDEFDRKVRDDKDLQKARERLEDARVARVAAETYFRGADLAAGSALDFAYWTHRYDYYRYNHSYDSYPYSSFYGYPAYGVAVRRCRSVP